MGDFKNKYMKQFEQGGDASGIGDLPEGIYVVDSLQLNHYTTATGGSRVMAATEIDGKTYQDMILFSGKAANGNITDIPTACSKLIQYSISNKSDRRAVGELSEYLEALEISEDYSAFITDAQMLLESENIEVEITTNKKNDNGNYWRFIIGGNVVKKQPVSIKEEVTSLPDNDDSKEFVPGEVDPFDI